MQQTASQVRKSIISVPLSQRVREISERVKVIRFGIDREAGTNPWDRLAGMFTVSRSVDIEEILDDRGFEETANSL